MIVRCPVKPSFRSVSAPRSPASEAPTITIRPLALNESELRLFMALSYSPIRLTDPRGSPAPGRTRRHAGRGGAAHRRGLDRTKAPLLHVAGERPAQEGRIARIPGTDSSRPRFACVMHSFDYVSSNTRRLANLSSLLLLAEILDGTEK